MNAFIENLSKISPVTITGQVLSVCGPIIGAKMCCNAAPGDIVEIDTRITGKTIEAEVLSCKDNQYALTPLENNKVISPGATIYYKGSKNLIHLSHKLIGTIVNSKGQIIEKFSTKKVNYSFPEEYDSPIAQAPSALNRSLISEKFHTGIRAIDGLLTLGQGSRIAVLAEPGVGKSTLLGMLAQSSSADINVIALIGERGREVKEFIECTLPESAKNNTICVVSTSDEPAALRVRASQTAMRIAEYFRDQGLNVMLQLDSLTRLVRALRELGLAAGEMPVRNGYPPSVFSTLPQFIERSGPGETGSITAFYTSLLTAAVEEDPMVEELISLTDGHIKLSSNLAAKGHYPAIDILGSLSRLQHLAEKPIREAANTLRAHLAVINEEKDSLLFGAEAGPELQKALELKPKIDAFLRQQREETSSYKECTSQLLEISS